MRTLNRFCLALLPVVPAGAGHASDASVYTALDQGPGQAGPAGRGDFGIPGVVFEGQLRRPDEET